MEGAAQRDPGTWRVLPGRARLAGQGRPLPAPAGLRTRLGSQARPSPRAVSNGAFSVSEPVPGRSARPRGCCGRGRVVRVECAGGFSQRPVCLRVCCRLPPQAPPPASRNVSRPSGPGGCRPPSTQLPGPSKPAWGPGPHPHCRVGASAGGRGSSSSCPVTPCSGQAGNPGPAQGRGAPASPRSEGKQPETGGKGSELWNSLPCLTSPCWGHAGKATENLRPAMPR